jgi:hypothetical protein
MPLGLLIFKELFGAGMELLKFVVTMSDEDFDKTSEVWPTPIKTKIVVLRARAKARKKFY